jgi:hypothetical protein
VLHRVAGSLPELELEVCLHTCVLVCSTSQNALTSDKQQGIRGDHFCEKKTGGKKACTTVFSMDFILFRTFLYLNNLFIQLFIHSEFI